MFAWSTYLELPLSPHDSAPGRAGTAPDLPGFGRSDKPAAREDFSYNRQVAWMNAWLRQNNLHQVTLVCQDWGG